MIPKLPRSYENCVIETPNGQKHVVPIYKPNIGPKSIDGRILNQKT